MGTNITGIGNANAIGFKSRVTGGIYFPPELKDALVGVWSAYGKSNDSTDRNIIKNKIKNRGGDFVISNAAFKLNSGFGKYEITFQYFPYRENVTNVSDSKVVFGIGGQLLIPYPAITENIPSFKIKVNGLSGTYHFRYYYRSSDGVQHSVDMAQDGYYELPICYNVQSSSDGTNCGFANNGTDVITITQIPSFEGAFVTDGINDLITSTKTVQEMLGGSNEFTVVSMMANLDSVQMMCNSNYNNTNGYNPRNTLEPNGVISMLGYTDKNGTTNNLNLIMGDKDSIKLVDKVNFNSDYVFYPAQYYDSYYKAAWYWTVIANKVLTTDEINQVIAYFNLDRTLNPDILCDVKKQGITNENHAEFGDKPIDFSGNGRDIQLNNLAWKLDSGIGKYETDLSDTRIWTRSKEITYSPFSFSYNGLSGWILFANTELTNSTDIPSFKIQIKGLLEGQELIYKYYDSNGQSNVYSMGKDGEYTLPSDVRTAKPQTSNTSGFQVVKNEANIITITQIPSHAGALCLDGVNDFGKVTGMPIYKDYTVVIDREIFANIGAILSKNNPGAFVETAGNSVYSFGQATSGLKFISTRSISYLSKYSYCGQSITAGAAEDGTDMWLGTIRDNDSCFFNGAIYSLMSFPYSMSEFLIERQLKKHKLGTLYPDMVEFRPVINSNVLLDSKPTFVIRGTSTYLNVGDYVPENSQIWVSIKMNNIADRITKFTVNGKTINISENAYSEVTLQYGFSFVIDKSPQKIGIIIEQDENYVLFNPVINSNVEYHKLDFYLNNYQKKINIGDYIPKGAYLRANFYLKNNVDELTVFTFNGVNIGYRKSSVDDTAFNIAHIYNYDSPQEVNITIDEYIRFEDIVQPYPVIFQITDRNTNQRYSWGDKIKVGSSIRLSQGEKPNLLSGLYSIQSYEYEGETYSYNQLANLNIILTKQSISLSCNKTWLLDDNEPKCILSPRLLRIPNSSYKLLGYIPDISGHGNHGVIHNSAYAEMSGANGYPYDYRNSSFWCDSVLAKVVSGELIEYFAVKNSTGFSNITSGVYKGEIKVTGVTKAISENKISRLRIYTNSTTDNELIDITQDGNYNIDIKGVGDANRVFFYAIPNNPNESIVVRLTEPIYIEQVGEYEGAYCLDGVDDFVTIPTIVGGKQVLMKMNWQNRIGLLYDQRKNGSSIDAFAILNVNSNNSIAYNSRNTDGETYIDGILNKNIVCPQLYKITHSITIINQLANKEEVISPTIGSDTTHKIYFSQMSLYDFMLFDEISTDDKIKELNEYVGIEAKVELPPYYWDAYGKTNLDEDRDSIKQRGVAVGDYDLTNTDFAYDKMSGFGGYEFTKFDNTSEWTNKNRKDGIEIIKKNGYSFTAKRIGTGQYFYDFQNRSTTVLNKSLTVKAVSNNNTCIRWEYKYRTAKKPDIDSTLLLVRQAMIPNVPITVALPYKTEQEKADLGVTEGSDSYLFYFDPSDIPVGEEYTVEMLPLYPNGLLYDAVTDYSENVNIPVFTDFTAIMKRKWLKNQGCPLIKGSKVYEGGNGNALLFEWDKAYNFVFYKRTDIMEGEVPENISFITPTNYNGNVITRGSGQDTNGICIAGDGNAGFANMVFYKLILYPKTIPLLQINFLKNLMEKDEIIDLNNPIFIKDE